jgi:hypothetical protein
MIGSVGLAFGAMSTLASLLEAATAGIEKAAGKAPPAPLSPSAAGQAFQAPPAPEAAPAIPRIAVRDPGPVLPKFDERTQAALIALQEQHRGA